MVRTFQLSSALFLTLLIGLSAAGCQGEDDQEGVENLGVPTEGFLYDSVHYLTLSPNTTPLSPGYGSAEELVDSLLRATATLDTVTLADLAISATEWREILYPEMGLHYPGMRDRRPEIMETLGELHFNASVKGLRRLLRDYGGERLLRASLELSGDTLRFPSFTLYEGVELELQDHRGEGGRVAFLGSFVEKDGVFKLLSYRDSERESPEREGTE